MATSEKGNPEDNHPQSQFATPNQSAKLLFHSEEKDFESLNHVISPISDLHIPAQGSKSYSSFKT